MRLKAHLIEKTVDCLPYDSEPVVKLTFVIVGDEAIADMRLPLRNEPYTLWVEVDEPDVVSDGRYPAQLILNG